MYKSSRATVAFLLVASGIIVSLLLGYKNEYTTGLASSATEIRVVKLAQDYLSKPSSNKAITAAGAGEGIISSNSKNVPGWNDALQSCRITDLPNDLLVQEYGQNNIRLSRTYEGSGTRVRKVMQKALRGEKIKIAVVGGSVSAVS